MKKALLLMALLITINRLSFGEDEVKVFSAGYSFFPLVNHSMLKFSYGARQNPYYKTITDNKRFAYVNKHGSVVKVFHSVQLNLFELSYMYPNGPDKTQGCLGLSVFGTYLKLGRGRLQLSMGGELLGISTLSESLGEKLQDTNKKVILTTSVSAGVDLYITSNLSVKASGGILGRHFIRDLYPYGSVTLSYDIPRTGNVYRYKLK